MSNEKLQEAVIRVMKDEEKYAKRNVNNVNKVTLFQSPVTVNSQKKDANVIYERRIASVILAETIKQFKECNIQSTINNFGYYDSNEQVNATNDSKEQVDVMNWLRNDSEEQFNVINDSEELVDAKSNPSSDPKVATYTTNGKFTQKLLFSWFVPKIIPATIRPVDQIVTEDLPGIREILGSRQMVLPKASVTDSSRSGACILRTPRKVSCTSRDRSTPQDVKSSVATARLNPPSPILNSNSISPARTGTQDIISPRRSIITTEARNAEPIDAPITIFSAVNGHLTSFLSKVIGVEIFSRESTNVNARKRMDFASSSVIGESPNFLDLGMLPANTADKLKSVFAPLPEFKG